MHTDQVSFVLYECRGCEFSRKAMVNSRCVLAVVVCPKVPDVPRWRFAMLCSLVCL